MNLARRSAATTQGAGLSITDFDRVLDMWYGGNPTYTGKPVSQSTALAISTLWACVDALSDDVSTLQLPVFRELPDDQGKMRAKDHYLWKLLNRAANPEMTAKRFKRLMETWRLLWGNAYAEIEISGRGQVVALWPWRPDRVRIVRATPNSPLVYQYKMLDGRTVSVPQYRMLHLRGLSLDGITGLSPIEYHRQTMGLSLAITEHGARFFGQGARPLGILSTPNTLGPEASARMKADWERIHGGVENAHRVAILEEGLKWQDVGATMVDAQYIETRGLTDEDIARIYKVPQHRIGLLKRATNNNIEQLSIEYVTYTLLPICEEWKEEIEFSCLSEREADTISVGFNFRNLLRGNYDSITRLIGATRQNGIFDADEIRDFFFDLNPLSDGRGKKVWEPVNMVSELGDNEPEPLPAAPAAPAQIVAPDDGPNGNGNSGRSRSRNRSKKPRDGNQGDDAPASKPAEKGSFENGNGVQRFLMNSPFSNRNDSSIFKR